MHAVRTSITQDGPCLHHFPRDCEESPLAGIDAFARGNATLAPGCTRLFAGPLMSRSAGVRRPATLAGDLALFLAIHRSEPASTTFGLVHYVSFLPLFVR